MGGKVRVSNEHPGHLNHQGRKHECSEGLVNRNIRAPLGLDVGGPIGTEAVDVYAIWEKCGLCLQLFLLIPLGPCASVSDLQGIPLANSGAPPNASSSLGAGGTPPDCHQGDLQHN